MKVRKDVLLTRDIDLFCLVSGVPIHLASAGCVDIPDLLNNRTKLIESQQIAYSLPNSFDDVFINTDLIVKKLKEEEIFTNQYLIEDDVEVEDDGIDLPDFTLEERIYLYSSSFVDFAHKGFFSFDRSFVTDSQSTLYDLIAFPCVHDFREMHLRLPTCQNEMMASMRDSQWLIQHLHNFEEINLNHIIV